MSAVNSPLPWESADDPADDRATDTTVPAYIASVREIEARVGVDFLDVVQEDRRRAVAQLAPLAARVGTASVYDARRKAFRCALANEIGARLTAERNGKHPAEAELERLAAGDPRYRAWLDAAEEEMARYHLLRDEVDRYTEIINRGQALIRWSANEPRV